MNGVFQQPSSRKSCLQRWEEILWAQTEPMAQLQQSAHRITCPLNWFQPSYPSPPIPHMHPYLHPPCYHVWSTLPWMTFGASTREGVQAYKTGTSGNSNSIKDQNRSSSVLRPSGPLLVPRLLLVFLASLIHCFSLKFLLSCLSITCIRYLPGAKHSLPPPPPVPLPLRPS